SIASMMRQRCGPRAAPQGVAVRLGAARRGGRAGRGEDHRPRGQPRDLRRLPRGRARAAHGGVPPRGLTAGRARYVYAVASDDWRLRIEVEDATGGFLDRIGLFDADARDLARELKHERLAVTRDGDTIFVYASSAAQLDEARKLLDAELAELRLERV